jgi:hypothetical protein
MEKDVTISADIPNIIHTNIIHDYYYDSKNKNWIFSESISDNDISLRHLSYSNNTINLDKIDEKNESLSKCFNIYSFIKSLFVKKPKQTLSHSINSFRNKDLDSWKK